MTSEEKMRAEFEEWFVPFGISITKANQAMCFANGRRVKVGDYILLESQVAYEGWKASRESLVIETPKKVNEWGTDNWADGYNLAVNRCIESIRAAGVKTK